ncbi:pyruvate dehydrogenase kinase [Chrysochromulina tobinii]|uniref:Protein-serine/threonine kinase n=1 Tax=Chrysochromulina tobinii TaxID=1460289 RepID=A0A0M0KA74_9EUKA|nr:pyruvate dehydrogenase kinase [Chrysochromulina tobinii]|eukprot:KOO35735.1 pyruvate dehydrogenase kinase [Chrysochromulina sp. CCMP291]
MKAIFRLYDTNNSGSLDLGELTSLLDDLDMLKTQRRKSAFCKQMLHEHDADADGALSFDEFQRLWPKVCRMQAVRLLNLDLPSEATKQGRRLRELMAAPATAVSISSLWQTAHEPTPAQSLLNAQFLHRELIVRRAGLLRMLTSLPSGLATHPRVLEIGELYRRLLAQLLNTSTPRDAETEWVFEHRLRTTFLTHTQVPAAIGAALHDLSNGARSPPTTEEQREIDSRLDAFFSSRLGLRFLAHHYLSSKVAREGWSGILHSKCSPVTVCRTAAADVRRWAKARFGVSPEVEDVGGGFGRSKLGAVWSYAGSRRLRAGHGGLGLPLSRLYARYFGGTLHVAPIEGYGTDAYVTLNRLEGANQETLYFIKDEHSEEQELEQRASRSEPSLLEEPGMLHDGLFDAQARRGSSSKSTGASDT